MSYLREGLEMKICKNCSRLNLDNAKKCIGCDKKQFIPIIMEDK